MSYLAQSISVVLLFWLIQVLMASPGGTSSASSLLHDSGSDEGLQAVMDEKKRKRLISNRESARRSRLRKQKHLDDLVAQANQLRKENSHGFAILKLVAQHCATVEAENSVLRAQIRELSSRLQSLDDRLHNLYGNNMTLSSLTTSSVHGTSTI
ncbi:ocs element-binding factor 1 [Musa troglodytarum]|uniref:Ocs element-binding factor 1 n=1 Tax=Musa troglodytarum TaxID=320322 RepID=A0A9E7GK03_9LILI|nr:ocs element-binding factor 1 [Musa troglodytarum]